MNKNPKPTDQTLYQTLHQALTTTSSPSPTPKTFPTRIQFSSQGFIKWKDPKPKHKP